MANYRINYPNSLFPGRRGSLISAEPGPMMDAAVKAGMMSRLTDDAPAPPPVVPPKPSKKVSKELEVADDDNDS